MDRIPTVPTKKTLVCIEANEDLQVLIQLCLKSIPDLEIHTTSSVEEWKSHLKSLSPDIILFDLDTSSDPVFQKLIKGPLKQVPIVLLSSRVRLTDKLKSDEQGIEIIQKPFDPTVLEKTINNIISVLNTDIQTNST